ncbi:MAG: gfo/Idh/MocA family oxidoreductase, partial [Planctomycetota bacterium]
MKRFHSRREALILGAASATAAFAAPMVRSAQNSLPRVAFIGTGGQGKSNMGALMKLTNPVAVCDVDSTRLAEAAAMVEKARPGVFADKDYRKILDRKDID